MKVYGGTGRSLAKPLFWFAGLTVQQQVDDFGFISQFTTLQNLSMAFLGN